MKIKLVRKKLIGLFFIILGVFSMIYGLAAASARVTFAGFFILVSLLLMLIGVLKLFFLKPIKSKLIKRSVFAFHILILLGFISFIIIEGFIIKSALQRDTKNADYIVILGAGLHGDVPSLTLLQRLRRGVELAELQPETKIVVSGGQGPGETVTEASAMKKYLVNNGVNADRIIMEEKSTSTLENLVFTKNVIRQTDEREALAITIITSDFHMFRSKHLAEKVGFKAYGYPSETYYYLVPAYYVREYLAVIKSFLFDKPEKLPAAEIGIQTDIYKGVAVFNNGKTL